jgi:hypothetical protein
MSFQINHIDGTREDFLLSLPKGLVIAELGVFRGEFSDKILAICKPKHLHLVDTFDALQHSGTTNGSDFVWVDMKEQREKLLKRMKGKRVSVVKSNSISWLRQQANLLDMVYIDSAHDFRTTSWEIWESQHAVRRGGLISGHDYRFSVYPGVVKAVNDFARNNGLVVSVWAKDTMPTFCMNNP